MNELDRTLHDAFQSRHVPHDITPSLVDVRWRARRRHTRRNAALVGCAAITGAGAVAVLATRHPGEQTGVGADAGEEPTATTIACYSFATTIVPTTAPFTIPVTALESTTTTGLETYQVPCEQGSGWTWHCTDRVGSDEFGRDVFLSCEQVSPGVTTIPPSTVEFVDTTIGFESLSTAFNTIPPFSPTTTNTVPITALEPMGTTTTSLG
ncbi:MAG: hypothetical protein HY828_06665 [Actinobacteria bacterium]|nr:hypothetical protein [Actinomycetota bacterium]